MVITLNDGRGITMDYLEQRRTYAGVLCGRFSARDNDRRIAKMVAEARERLPWLGEIHAIAPVRQKLPFRPDSAAPDAERLPPVATLAAFVSKLPANDEGEVCSSAAFLWFQADFGLPDEHATAALRATDWRSVAFDWTP